MVKTKKDEYDLSNYATKSDVKNEIGFDKLDFAKKADLASLKSDVDELDIDKLKTVPTDLVKLNNAADNAVAEKIV